LFLNEFASEGMELSSTSNNNSGKIYLEQAKAMKDGDITTMYVDFQHMLDYNADLALLIQKNYYRIEPFLSQAVLSFMKTSFREHAEAKAGDKVFFVSFYNMGEMGMSKLRDLRSDSIGNLKSFTGTVTRTSQVRPELVAGNFRCLKCQHMVMGVKQQFKFTEPTICPVPACGNKEEWMLDVVTSSFVDWQMVRVQENAADIPPGSMPRSIKVILRNEVVESAKPGDNVIFTGSLIVVPDVAALSNGKSAGLKKAGGRANTDYGGLSGLKALGVRDLTYKLCFLACNVQSSHTAAGALNARDDGDADTIATDFTQEERERILEMRNSTRLYSRMVHSVAPNIFGHAEIKRGVLLMLLGGVHKNRKGANLRGDINVCIVGDPSTSKSQFLKYTCSFLPRAIYTSGKASSAAGLTASVVRDNETGEFTIEAGALMLADNGVCCIDEFDKMAPGDQVAIHEAMEQQTISIAKAGIQATLNARTSILAAANPVRGRYDPSLTLKQNVDISAPIMSRFDLFFVVLDECDEITDFNIAKHILGTHKQEEPDVDTRPSFSMTDLQTYIRFARTLKPQISKEAKQALIKHYTSLRTNDSASSTSKSSYRITVRQLESMVRLAEARARLDLEKVVTVEHVDEAARLLQKSIVNVMQSDISLDGEEDGAEGEEEDENMGDANNNDNDDDNDSSKKTAAAAEKIVVTFSEYKRISNMLVLYIRQQEEADSNFHGFTRDQLVSWYLSEMESELQEAGASLKASKLCRLIIARLADTDRILIGDETKGLDSRKLTVHPNYNVEEGNTANLDSTDAETSAQETDLSESEADSIVSSVRAGRSPSRKAAAPAPASPATPTPPAEGASTPTSASRTRSSGRLSRK